MCGIAGYINKYKNKPISEEILIYMAAIQYHRGPDDFGYEIFQDAGIGMSHTRLAIIDLHETGRQPFISNDKNLMLSHNGEFYDFKRIRTFLSTKGFKFKSKSDSEIVLHLYRYFGFEKMLDFLRGEFAFALFDKEKDTLYIVRDRFGIKPVYWTITENSLIFGSEIKSLFIHPEVERNFYPEGIYHQLMQIIVPDSTPYKNIHQVKPGHYLKVKRNKDGFEVKQIPYWDMIFPEEKDRERKELSYYVDGVAERLIEAVHLRLEADVPVGCYLSGGIDSCSILGLAANYRQDPVKAFTIGFDHDKYDESKIAIEMAKSVSADQDILMLNADHLYDYFEITHWHTERTIYNTLAVAKYLMSKHVYEQNYRVVVTGEGSDELFAGYPAFRKDMFKLGLSDPEERAILEKELEKSNQLVKGSMLAPEEINDPYLNEIFGFTPSCLQTWLATTPYILPLLSNELKETLKDYQPGKAIAEQFNEKAIKNRHPLDKAQYAWIKTMLEGQILTWGGDRVDMANSMEARPAFLDHHLAEFATKIPPDFRIYKGIEKFVLREAMKGILPKILYERKKFAFMAPPAHTDPKKLNALKQLANEYLSYEEIQKTRIFSLEGINQLFKKLENPEMTHTELVQIDAIINHILGLQILHKKLIREDLYKIAKNNLKRYKNKERIASFIA